jgi:uncharacterized protein (DUF58 family)
VGYLVHFILLLVLALPPVGLLVSLPALIRCRVTLAPSAPQVKRGEELSWSVVVEGGAPRLSLRLVTENRMTGQRGSCRLKKKDAAPGLCWQEDASTDRCGHIVCRAESIWAYDCLGLFPWPVKKPEAAEVFVCPVEEMPKKLNLSERGAVYRPVPGAGESYELRPYRLGDSLRQVHWKASAKRGDLVVRESLERRLPPLVVSFRHGGTPEEQERTLDRLAGLVHAALRRERSLLICWTGAGGEARRYPVENDGDWRDCLTAILSDPATAQTSPPGAHIQVSGAEAKHER